jgi:hypothetical protein
MSSSLQDLLCFIPFAAFRFPYDQYVTAWSVLNAGAHERASKAKQKAKQHPQRRFQAFHFALSFPA